MPLVDRQSAKSTRRGASASPLLICLGVRRASRPGVAEVDGRTDVDFTLRLAGDFQDEIHAASGSKPARLIASRATIVGLTGFIFTPCTSSFHGGS